MGGGINKDTPTEFAGIIEKIDLLIKNKLSEQSQMINKEKEQKMVEIVKSYEKADGNLSKRIKDLISSSANQKYML